MSGYEEETLTQETLKKWLVYEPETGHFIRTIFSGGHYPGEIAGSTNDGGYILIGVEGRQYRAHRLAYLYMTGQWPIDLIDHRNGVRSDNRWKNLRATDTKTNTAAGPNITGKGNVFGVPGVLWNKDKTLIVPRIRVDGKYEVYGSFVYLKDAFEKHRAAKRHYHGVVLPEFEAYEVENVKGTGRPYFQRPKPFKGQPAEIVLVVTKEDIRKIAEGHREKVVSDKKLQRHEVRTLGRIERMTKAVQEQYV